MRCSVCVVQFFGELYLNSHPKLQIFPECTCHMGAAFSHSPDSDADAALAVLVENYREDAAALAAYRATRRGKMHGKWSAAQHLDVKRVIFTQSFRIAQRHVNRSTNSAHMQALSEVANSAIVMSIVFGFAIQYCTPTPLEREQIREAVDERMTGEISDVKYWLNWLHRGLDPNEFVSVMPTTLLLVLAAEKKCDKVVNMLLRNGADASPLYLNIKGEGVNYIEEVAKFTALGADVNKTERDDETPLFKAANTGRLELVNALLVNGADINKQVETHKGVIKNPLYIAIARGHTKVVNALLAKGAKVKGAKVEALKVLFLAVSMGNGEIVQALLDRGAKVDEVGVIDGTTSLLVAAQNGNVAVVNALLGGGADVNKARSDGLTPLYIAAQNGDVAVVNALLRKDADVNKALNDGLTPLWVAAQNGYVAVVNALLVSNADVNKASSDGLTPLWIAVQNGHAAVVSELLERGADKTISYHEETPLQVARRMEHAAIIALLADPV